MKIDCKATPLLLQACEILGKDLHGIAASDLELRIASFCEGTNVRFRKVLLKGHWWKQYSGPLMGFYGTDQLPVALLNDSDHSYEMQKPAGEEKRAVDSDLAKEIAEYAYVFYSPLPSKTFSGKEMVKNSLNTHFKDLFQLTIYSCIAAIFALFPLLAIFILFDTVIPNASFSLIRQIGMGLVITAVGSSIFLYFRSLKLVKIEGELSHNIQVGIWDRLVRLPIKFFQKFSSGTLIPRIFSVENIRLIASGNSSRVFITSIFTIFYLIAMFLLAPLLASIGVFFVVLSLIITYICVKNLTRLEKKILAFQGKINEFLFQVVKAIAKLRSAGAEKNVFSNWLLFFNKKKNFELKKKNLRSVVLICNYYMPLLGVACILTVVIEWRRVYSVGEFIAFMMGYTLFSMQIAELNSKWIEMTPIVSLWNHVKAILQEVPEDRDHRESPGELSGEISTERIYFRRDSNGPYLLEDVSIKIHPHEFIGIVGRSGSGKSTLIRHLIGFETPTSGAVSYDGKDLTRINHQKVRKQLGLVMQESAIIQGTILENLTCGQSYTDKEIETALYLSGLEEEMKEFPMGLFTLLPMGVEALSGGQKQKILIARALLPNPKILIFDEAISALDNIAQLQLIKRLSNLSVTKVIVAHRLSTVKNADRIYVLEKGKVAQVGRFEELASKPGPFFDMFHVK